MSSCAHCSRELLSGRRFYCDNRCKMAAYRRRRAGRPQDELVGRGRRGRVPLSAMTREELLAELEQIRSSLSGIVAVLAARDLLERNCHLAEAVDRLNAFAAARTEYAAEQDATVER